MTDHSNDLKCPTLILVCLWLSTYKVLLHLLMLSSVLMICGCVPTCMIVAIKHVICTICSFIATIYRSVQMVGRSIWQLLFLVAFTWFLNPGLACEFKTHLLHVFVVVVLSSSFIHYFFALFFCCWMGFFYFFLSDDLLLLTIVIVVAVIDHFECHFGLAK